MRAKYTTRSDPATDMSMNTIEHLPGRHGAVRAHLGIEQWLLHGGSWGSTLILAYAERHPERVSEIVIPGVTTDPAVRDRLALSGRRRASSPRRGSDFEPGSREAERDADLVAVYARLMEAPDDDVRGKAVANWLALEDAVISEGSPRDTGRLPLGRPVAQIAFVRICASILPRALGLRRGAAAGRDLASGIRGVLIHGRLDMGSPVGPAWDLACAWPDAEFCIGYSGHTGSEAMRRSSTPSTSSPDADSSPQPRCVGRVGIAGAADWSVLPRMVEVRGRPVRWGAMSIARKRLGLG